MEGLRLQRQGAKVPQPASKPFYALGKTVELGVALTQPHQPPPSPAGGSSDTAQNQGLQAASGQLQGASSGNEKLLPNGGAQLRLHLSLDDSQLDGSSWSAYGLTQVGA